MTEEKSIEELEAEYRAYLEKEVSTFKEKEAEKIKAQKEADEKERYEELKASLINSVKEEVLGKYVNTQVTGTSDDPVDPKPNTENDQPGSNTTSTKEVPELFTSCVHSAKRTAKKAGFELKNLPRYTDENMMKNYIGMGIDAFKATNSDSDCEDDVSAWEKEDYFVDAIWFEIICSSDFLGKIGHRKYDYQAGAGGQIQIKQISIPSPAHDWANAATLDPCECISCVSNAFTTYTLQIKKYGDAREICNADLLLAGMDVKTAVLETMRIRLAERIDNEIWSNLIAATPGSTVTSDVVCSAAARGTDGDCCTYSLNLFDDIIDLHDQMWNAGYFRKSNPVLILNKTVSALLKYKDGLSPQIKSALKFEGTSLTGIGEIQVIESCHAPTCASAATNAIIAVMLDPDRAFAEVWAQKPKYQSDPNIDCDSVTHVVWAYGAFDTLDEDAIGFIRNPKA